MKRRIAIAGNGAWGQALAHVARTAGHDVSMWSRQKSDVVSFASLDAIIVAVRPGSATIRIERTSDAVSVGDLVALHR